MLGFGRGFWTGFCAPLAAIRLITRSPWMLTLVIIPLAINVCIYSIFFHYGAEYLDHTITDFLNQLQQHLPPWLMTASRWGLKLMSWLILGLIAALSFTLISGIISAPFNDYLSRAAVKARLAELRSFSDSASSIDLPMRDLSVGQTLGLELKRMTILIGGTIVAILIGLIPLMQIPALALGAMLVSFEYFGYPISQRSSSLTPVVWFTLRHPAVSLGLGTFLLLIMALPFTSVFYIPLAVVAGTVLYVDRAVATDQTASRSHA